MKFFLFSTLKKIIDQRYDVYFMSDKEANSAHSGTISKIDQHSMTRNKRAGLLFS